MTTRVLTYDCKINFGCWNLKVYIVHRGELKFYRKRREKSKYSLACMPDSASLKKTLKITKQSKSAFISTFVVTRNVVLVITLKKKGDQTLEAVDCTQRRSSPKKKSFRRKFRISN